MENVRHNIPPVYNQNSKILILGTMPSPKSREAKFFYGHPGNRFWAVLATLFKTAVPQTNEDKTHLLLKNRVAVWDVLESCDISGASDSSIKNEVPNNIAPILTGAQICRIYCTGKTALKLYQKHIYPICGMQAHYLPSTSGANARLSIATLCEHYKDILEYI